MCNKMSDVRLSNASPTLERVDARQPDNVRPPVRRSLFGSPDPEGIRRYLTAAMQEDVQDFMDEYNFDPVNDRPLTPRNYDWQEDSDAPEFFRRPPHQRDADSPGDNNRQDAEETSGRQSAESSGRQSADRRQSLGKRRSGDPGPCSSECPSKRSHTDEYDDEDEPDGAASQAVRAAEERPSRPEKSAEVQ